MKGDTSSEYKTCRLNMNFNRKIVGGGTVDTKIGRENPFLGRSGRCYSYFWPTYSRRELVMRNVWHKWAQKLVYGIFDDRNVFGTKGVFSG